MASCTNDIISLRELATRIAVALSNSRREVSPELVLEVIKSWLAGRRVPMLPGGEISVGVSAMLEDIERDAPGAIAALTDE